jgi:hypothetical protein
MHVRPQSDMRRLLREFEHLSIPKEDHPAFSYLLPKVDQFQFLYYYSSFKLLKIMEGGYLIVFKTKYDKCSVCCDDIPKVIFSEKQPNNCIICEKCYLSLPIVLSFDCSDIPDLNDFTVEVDQYVTFNQLLTDNSVYNLIGHYDIYLNGFSKSIFGDKIVSSDVYFVKINYNYFSAKNAVASWDNLPNEIKAPIRYRQDLNFCIPDLYNQPRLQPSNLSMETFISYLIKIDSDVMLPRISMKDILVLKSGKCVLLPFSNHDVKFHIIEALDFFVRKRIALHEFKLDLVWRSILAQRLVFDNFQTYRKNIEQNIVEIQNELKRVGGQVILSDFDF